MDKLFSPDLIITGTIVGLVQGVVSRWITNIFSWFTTLMSFIFFYVINLVGLEYINVTSQPNEIKNLIQVFNHIKDIGTYIALRGKAFDTQISEYQTGLYLTRDWMLILIIPTTNTTFDMFGRKTDNSDNFNMRIWSACGKYTKLINNIRQPVIERSTGKMVYIPCLGGAEGLRGVIRRNNINNLTSLNPETETDYVSHGFFPIKLRILDYMFPSQRIIIDDICQTYNNIVSRDSLFTSHIVLMCGSPGVGKTYISHLLTYYLNGIEVTIDENTMNSFSVRHNPVSPYILVWDEFDTYLDRYIEASRKKESGINKDEVNMDNSQMNILSTLSTLATGKKHDVSDLSIKKLLTAYFDKIYQMNKVILILITNKPRKYFTENPELDFLTRSMRVHRIYDINKCSSEDNKAGFERFIKIFNIENWTDDKLNNIDFDKMKISDMYSAFNFANGDPNKLIENLNYMKVINEDRDTKHDDKIIESVTTIGTDSKWIFEDQNLDYGF